eukprot:TRINITY_DN7828_c0_g1_i2.p1 TRINITY_DN7828_c0_g1~~TRINITY_DN7828_c0_g1_i2.p1  ORF type:complete len:125 (-),score=20.30 TRINITY_DN7828_c0_g1_i2:49-423(-)
MAEQQNNSSQQQQYQQLPNEEKPLQKIQPQPEEIDKLKTKPTTRFSERLYCQYCQTEHKTEVELKVGLGTYLCSFLIAAVGGIFGCCLIPCCVDDCKDAVHKCCLLYTSPSPRDRQKSRMPSSA